MYYTPRYISVVKNKLHTDHFIFLIVLLAIGQNVVTSNISCVGLRGLSWSKVLVDKRFSPVGFLDERSG